MELIAKADVVLALGTRLNPFSTLPGYGIDYWPKNAKIIQVDMNSDRIGLTKKVTVGICGDAKLVAQQILGKLSPKAGDTDRQKRKDLIHQTKSAWLQKLSSLDHEDDDPGTVWNKEALFEPMIKYAIHAAAGYTLRYNVNGNGTRQGTQIANRQMIGVSGAYTKYAATADDYRAQEFPNGTIVVQDAFNLNLERT